MRATQKLARIILKRLFSYNVKHASALRQLASEAKNGLWHVQSANAAVVTGKWQEFRSLAFTYLTYMHAPVDFGISKVFWGFVCGFLCFLFQTINCMGITEHVHLKPHTSISHVNNQ